MVHCTDFHCADLHLDKGFNIPNLARASERKEDLNRNFSEIVEYALRNKPDLFIVYSFGRAPSIA
jgi:DNA repair exonuclease SbcCD nuclease subunit